MKEKTAWIDRAYATGEARLELEKERFVQDVTAALLAAMVDSEVSQADVAAKLGKSPAFVSQVLSGRRNCTLHTVAEVAWATGIRLGVDCEILQPLSHQAFRSTSNVLSIRRIAIKPQTSESLPAVSSGGLLGAATRQPSEIVA